MSTRSQILVKAEGLDFSYLHRYPLYHQCDGYPSNILPLIRKAYKKAIGQKQPWGGIPALAGYIQRDYPDAWEAGRPEKVASFLCAVEPGAFVPMLTKQIGNWIEWYYVITAVNIRQGCTTDFPTWKVDVYDRHIKGRLKSHVGCAIDIGHMPLRELNKLIRLMEESDG